MNDKMKNLAVRTLSGLVLVAVMLGAVVWSPISFGLLLAVLLVGGMLEFYALAAAKGARPQRALGTVLGLLLFCLFYLPVIPDAPKAFGDWWLAAVGAPLLLSVPAMLICELYRKSADPVASVGTTLLGICYVAVPLVCFGWLVSSLAVPAAAGWSPWIAVAYLCIIWANDVFAYLVGMALGRHRLFERLSPKKSWEGFFGGLAGAVAVGIAAGWLFGGNLWAWGGLALVVAATGVLGDLTESMFKRAAGVKDSGRSIPGHGGVLDRFDAVLLSAPFALIYLLFCRWALGIELLVC